MPVREPFQMPRVGPRDRKLKRESEVWLQPARHCQAEGQQAGQPRDFRPKLKPIFAAGELLKRELQIDNEAESLEPMAHPVKAQIQQFIVRSELPATLSLEICGERSPQGFLHVEIERQGILNVVVQFHGRAFAVPLAVVIIGDAGDEPDCLQGVAGARQIGFGHQQVEVVAHP